MIRDDMLEALRQGECQVTFVKSDNSIRVMKCTLALENNDDVPESYSSNPNSQIDRITVWDLEKKAWRQFIIERVLDFKS